MATELETLVVKIQGDVSDLNSKFDEASAHVKEHAEGMAAAIQAFTDSSGHSFLDFHHAAETALGVFGGELLMKGLEMAAEAVAHFFEILHEGVAIASENELTITRLGVALGTAGQYSKEASEKVQEFAEALSHQSNYSQDAILKGSALIETLGKLDEEGLTRATKAAVTLSAALGIDLQTASMLVGRAAEGNIGTFTRYGLAVEKGATDSETFANALKAIEGLGDAAAAQANTYAGAVTGLGNQYEELLKGLGQIVTQNPAVIGAFKAAAEILGELTQYVSANKQEIKLLVAEGLVLAVSVTQVFIDTLNVAWKTGLKAFEDIMVPLKLLVSAIIAAGDAIHGNFAKAWDDMKTGAQIAFKDVADASGKNGLDAVSKGLDAVGVAAAKGFLQIQSGAEQAGMQFTNMAPAVKKATAEVSAMAAEGKRLADQLSKLDPTKEFKDQEKLLKSSLDARKITVDQYAQGELDALDKKYADEQKLLDAALNEKQISEDDYLLAVAQMEEDHDREEEEQANKKAVREKRLRDEKFASTATAFGNLSSLTKTHNAELIQIGRQAAVAQALMDGYAAAAKTWALWGYPWGIPMVAAQAVATGIQVANIEGVGLATGIDSVPGIGAFDNFPAVLAPGERVVPAKTNEDLTSFLQGGGGSGQQVSLLASINQKLDNLAQIMAGGTVIEIDGQKVFAAIRNQMRGGRVFA